MVLEVMKTRLNVPRGDSLDIDQAKLIKSFLTPGPSPRWAWRASTTNNPSFHERTERLIDKASTSSYPVR